MDITIAIIIGLIFVIIVLALATASIASAYKILFDKFEDQGKKSASEKDSLKRDTKKLEVTQELLEEERAILKQSLDEVVGREAGEFQKTLEEIKVEALRLFGTIGESAKGEIRADISEFRKVLSSKVDQEMKAVKLELEQYKSSKKAELDQKTKDILKEVALQVLPEAIDIDKHEDIVIRALEKAKADKFFD